MALILTRRPGESVKIGENVTMTVREVHPKKIYVVFEDGGKQEACWARLDERFEYFGSQARITVTAITGRQVRLAFEADRSVKIVRAELLK